MQMNDIKKSIFLNLMAISSYIGLFFIYMELYSCCVIYSAILPIFLVINIIGFAVEVHKKKLFIHIPDKISDNIIFTIIFYIGLLLSIHFLSAFILFFLP